MNPIVPVWRTSGASVPGSRHLRHGLPNQDAWLCGGSPSAPVFAVSDGHGGQSSPRSHVGARLAVGLAVELLAEPATLPDLTLSEAETVVGSLVSEVLILRWRLAVETHAAEHPFDNPRDSHPLWVAYGCTLLLACVRPDGIVIAQIGDGDILAVAADGAVTRPMPPDDRPVGHETASLSDLAPVASLRVVSVPAASMPPLVMLATDGYANSFRTDHDFLQVGSDLLKMILEEGFEPIAESLPGWLAEASATGSGDDITVGLLYCQPTMERIP